MEEEGREEVEEAEIGRQEVGRKGGGWERGERRRRWESYIFCH